MTKRIFRCICLVSAAALLVGMVCVIAVLYRHFSRQQLQQLSSETALTAHAVANQGMDFFQGLTPTEFRITWVAGDGTVLYDSLTPAEEMPNHLQREEIREALESGSGTCVRYSDTAMERLFYCARRLPDGSVIRLSASQSTLLNPETGMLQPIFLIFLLCLVFSFLLAYRLTRNLVQPLKTLDPEAPLTATEYAELHPLLLRIRTQQDQLRRQSAALERREQEFDTVTASMSEGLVLLSGNGLILSINPAAAWQLGIRRSWVGKDFLSMTPHPQVQELVRTALFGRHAERTVALSGKVYLIDAAPVLADSMVSGVVLLLIDVTEKHQAEALRREFTANVSHELKTPLHAISGYAELLKSGLVQPGDVESFSRKIYTETQRLIRLVEDILRLSRLDEGGEDMKKESLDLLALAQDAVTSLQPQARQARVSLTLTGESTPMEGYTQQLMAIISNLLSNAVKYNRPGGAVTVTLDKTEAGNRLRVADTGIGIPPEHQDRVFERFYRVDKSHSKAVGGTGLGLSIVKHAAALHNARVTLESTPNVGTTVTVVFPG